MKRLIRKIYWKTERFTVPYIVLIHIISFLYIISTSPDFYTCGILNNIVRFIVVSIIFIAGDIVFFLPSLLIITFFGIMGAVFSVAFPVFLILSLLQVMGADNINVLMTFGFWNTFWVLLIMTPIGIFNTLIYRHIL